MKIFLKMSAILTLLLLTACNKSSNSRNDFVPNIAPVVSTIVDQEITANEASAAIAVSISDEVTADADLQISVASSNETVIANSGLSLSNLINGVAELTITPIDNQIGQSTIGLTVTDEGNFVTTVSFNVSVVAAQVSAASFIRSTFANDKNSEPVSINAVELIQDVTDENEFDDLIDS